MSELATLHLSAAVPLAIERLRSRGGVTERVVGERVAKEKPLRRGVISWG